MPDKAYRIKFCWGIESGECPNLIQAEEDLQNDLQAVLDASGWPECLQQKLTRQIRPLDQFSISVSGCPNACSRPQIADFGLLQAQEPRVEAGKCSGCAECTQACREGAIALEQGIAGIDLQQCLFCGTCIRACPETAIYARNQGYRVQVGGKLGRRPRLAEELPGIHNRDELLDRLHSCLKLHQRHYQPGIRFGQVLAVQGKARLLNQDVSHAGQKEQSDANTR